MLKPDKANPWIRVPLAALLFGVLAWILDAVADYFVYYHGQGTFLELAFTSIPAHELYIRMVILSLFVIFGVFLGKQWQRLLRTQNKLSEQVQTPSPGRQ